MNENQKKKKKPICFHISYSHPYTEKSQTIISKLRVILNSVLVYCHTPIIMFCV